MFGKKKELEYQNKIKDITEGIKDTKGRLDEKLEELLENEEQTNKELNNIKEKDEDAKRDLAYIGIISDEMLKGLSEQRDIVINIAQRSDRLTEGIRDKDLFDLERLNNSNGKLLDGIRVEDRALMAIREEIRGLETISTSLKDMVNQTSALSLNAAIMGARLDAGNEGFVQTATEIKELAVECTKVIAELNRRLENIHNSLDEADKECGSLREAAGESNLAAAAIDKAYKDISDKFVPRDEDRDSELLDMDKLIDKATEINQTITQLGQQEDDKLYVLSQTISKTEQQSDITGKIQEDIQRLDQII